LKGSNLSAPDDGDHLFLFERKQPTSQQRRRRLEALERRQIRGPSWRDPYDTIMRLWDDLQAVTAGKACWVHPVGLAR
jgi:hypothetical protein